MTRYKKSDFIRWPLILAYDVFEYRYNWSDTGTCTCTCSPKYGRKHLLDGGLRGFVSSLIKHHVSLALEDC